MRRKCESHLLPGRYIFLARNLTFVFLGPKELSLTVAAGRSATVDANCWPEQTLFFLVFESTQLARQLKQERIQMEVQWGYRDFLLLVVLKKNKTIIDFENYYSSLWNWQTTV